MTHMSIASDYSLTHVKVAEESSGWLCVHLSKGVSPCARSASTEKTPGYFIPGSPREEPESGD